MILEPQAYFRTDLIVLTIVVFVCIRAYRKGVLATIYGMFSVVLSFIFAVQLYEPITSLLGENDSQLFSGQGLRMLVLIFVGFRILFFVLGRMWKAGSKKGVISLADHLVGLGLGVIEAYIIVSMWMFVCTLPIIKNGDDYRKQSVLLPIVEAIDPIKEDFFGQDDA